MSKMAGKRVGRNKKSCMHDTENGPESQVQRFYLPPPKPEELRGDDFQPSLVREAQKEEKKGVFPSKPESLNTSQLYAIKYQKLKRILSLSALRSSLLFDRYM